MLLKDSEVTMDFKGLVDHYQTLPKSELIEKLVFKNARLLNQDNVIEKLEDEVKRIEEVDQGHQKLNGELSEKISQLQKQKEILQKAIRKPGENNE
jgi:hypothetical protein